MPKEEQLDARVLQKHFELAVQSAKIILWRYNAQTRQAVTMQEEAYLQGLPAHSLAKLPESLFPYLEDKSIESVKAFYKALNTGAPAANCEMWFKQTKERAATCIQSFATRITGEGDAYYCWSQDITLEKWPSSNMMVLWRESYRILPALFLLSLLMFQKIRLILFIAKMLMLKSCKILAMTTLLLISAKVLWISKLVNNM